MKKFDFTFDDFWVMLPNGFIEVWDRDRWFHNFILPGRLSDDKRYDWCCCVIENHNYTEHKRFSELYQKQCDFEPQQLSLF